MTSQFIKTSILETDLRPSSVNLSGSKSYQGLFLPQVNVATAVPGTKGKLVYNIPDDLLYYSDGNAWLSNAGGPPSGAAGGSLAGTYPNPTIAASGAVAGAYGSNLIVPTFTLGVDGRITAAVNAPIPLFTNVTNGIVPASGGGATAFLRADSTWAVPAGGGTVTSVGSGTGLTGGPIVGAGVLDIANTTVVAGAYGDANNVASFTVNAQGQLTAAANVAIATATLASLGGASLVVSGVEPNFTLKGISSVTGITLTQNVNDIQIDLNDTLVVPAAYGSATSVGTFTVDQQGRLTAAADVAITQASLSNAGVAIGNETLVVDGAGPTLSTKGLVAGANITLTQVGATDLQISSTGGSTAILVSPPQPSPIPLNDVIFNYTGPLPVVSAWVAGAVTITLAAGTTLYSVVLRGDSNGLALGSLNITFAGSIAALTDAYPNVQDYQNLNTTGVVNFTRTSGSAWVVIPTNPANWKLVAVMNVTV